MDKFKKTFAFLFFTISGMVLGGLLAMVCAGTPYFDWLSWGRDLGIENFAIDLYVIKFNLGFMLHATISQIFTITIALALFSKIGKNL
jgi:hypothetical protein